MDEGSMGGMSERLATPALKTHRTPETVNGRITFAQPQMHRQKPVKRLEFREHALAEMLQGPAADLCGQTLESLNTQAVIGGCLQ